MRKMMSPKLEDNLPGFFVQQSGSGELTAPHKYIFHIQIDPSSLSPSDNYAVRIVSFEAFQV